MAVLTNMKFHIASHIHASPAALFRAPCLFSWCEHFLAFVRRFVFYAFSMNYAQKIRKKQRFTLYIAIHILHLFFRTVHAFFTQKTAVFRTNSIFCTFATAHFHQAGPKNLVANSSINLTVHWCIVLINPATLSLFAALPG